MLTAFTLIFSKLSWLKLKVVTPKSKTLNKTCRLHDWDFLSLLQRLNVMTFWFCNGTKLLCTHCHRKYQYCQKWKSEFYCEVLYYVASLRIVWNSIQLAPKKLAYSLFEKLASKTTYSCLLIIWVMLLIKLTIKWQYKVIQYIIIWI